MSATEPAGDTLFVWLVYQRPNDHPEHVVARLYRISPHAARRTGLAVLGANLKDCRNQLPPGLTHVPGRLMRNPNILEAWL